MIQEYYSRYARQTILPQMGLEGQEKLTKAKVLVIGCGGLGGPVLSYLAAAGVGTIGLIEFDTVSLSNPAVLSLQTKHECFTVFRPIVFHEQIRTEKAVPS